MKKGELKNVQNQIISANTLVVKRFDGLLFTYEIG